LLTGDVQHPGGSNPWLSKNEYHITFYVVQSCLSKFLILVPSKKKKKFFFLILVKDTFKLLSLITKIQKPKDIRRFLGKNSNLWWLQ